MKHLKFIIILIVIIIAVYGCTTSKDVDNLKNTPAPSFKLANNSSTLNIHNFQIEKSTALPSFVKLISDRYGIELKIHDRVDAANSGQIAKLDGLLFCYADSTNEYMKNKTKKYFTLNSFLKENKVFNLLPEQYRKSLKDENGDIWSLPTQQVFFLNRRVYDEEIMDRYNHSVPTTVNELVKLLYDVRSNDSYMKLLLVTHENCLWQLKDIMEYYGLTVHGTKNNNGIIGWNEEAQRFEDTICNLDADSLFATVEYMKSNSLYEIYESGFGPDINDTKIFTKMTTSNRKQKYMSEPFYKHKEYIFSYKTNSILMPLGTTNPKASLNLFIDTFFGSNEGNIYGYHGESGRTVTYDDSFTQVNFLTSDQMVFNEDGSIYFIGLVGPWLNTDYTHYSPKLDADSNEKNAYEWSEFNKMLLQKLETDSIEVLAQYKNLYTNSNLGSSQINGYFNNMFFEYVNSDIDRDSLIKEYVSKMKKMGAEELINENNKKVNAISMFYYEYE